MPKDIAKILIIDDNQEVLIALEMYLKKHFTQVDALQNPNMLSSKLEQTKYDVFILDMNFSAGINTGNEGLFWMRKILKIDPNAIIVLITAYADLELAVKAIKEGATDFISKPWDNKKLLATILSALKLRASKLKINKLESKQQHLISSLNKPYPSIIGHSPKMRSIQNLIGKVAKTNANVLILGENGTGKEVIAREIHNKSKRKDEIFVNVDLASLTESLFESELFGHKKGAFTDAKIERIGRFELASGGTLFLDEIGNLSMAMQAKLLSVIQNKQIAKIGSSDYIDVDVRLLCATNKPLYEMVEDGTFREDLLYRINTIQIDLPPLRERIEDIPYLIHFFLNHYAEKYNKPKLSINKASLEMLSKNPWYGNIRELKHTIEKAVILSEGKLLTASDFTLNKKRKANSGPSSFKIEDHEKYLITNTLKEFNGNLTETATALGITRATLYRKMKKYEI